MRGDSLTRAKYLTMAESAHLMAIILKESDKNPRNSLLLLLMLKGGLRPQETLNLTWDDVDFINHRIFVKTLKGGKDRYIPIKGLTLECFRILGCDKSVTMAGRVFEITYSRFVKIWHSFRPVKKKLHSLRHTFAVNLYRASNYDVKLVQQALGHRNLTTTQIYLDLEADDKALSAAMDSM